MALALIYEIPVENYEILLVNNRILSFNWYVQSSEQTNYQEDD